jgi:hypothetical protein
MRRPEWLLFALACVPYLGVLVPARVRSRLPPWSADAVGVYGLVVVAGYAAAVGLPPLKRLLRRRSGQCAQCGYDLTGNLSGTCPECGTAGNNGG